MWSEKDFSFCTRHENWKTKAFVWNFHRMASIWLWLLWPLSSRFVVYVILIAITSVKWATKTFSDNFSVSHFCAWNESELDSKKKIEFNRCDSLMRVDWTDRLKLVSDAPDTKLKKWQSKTRIEATNAIYFNRSLPERPYKRRLHPQEVEYLKQHS